MRGVLGRVTPPRVAAVCLLAGLIWLVTDVTVDLSHSVQQRAGTNYVDVSHFVVDIAPKYTMCQHELIPKDTGGARMLVTSYHQPTPSMRLFVRGPGGRVLTSTRVAAGWVEGMHDFEFPAIRRTTDAQLCLSNLGPRVHLTIAGENVPENIGLKVDGQPTTSQVFVQYLRPGVESYWSIAPLVLSRMRQAKAGWFGPWVSVLLVMLLLGCIAGTLLIARRACA